MGLSPEQINSIVGRGIDIERLKGTAAERLFRQRFDVGREARIAEDIDISRDIAGEEFRTKEDRLERRLGISERQVSVSEARNRLAAARDKVSLEHTAALTVGAKQDARQKKIELDEYDRIVEKIDRGGSLTASEQSTYNEAIGVPVPPRPVSQVPAERLAFSKRQAIIKSEEKIGLNLGKKEAVASHVKSYNEAMAAEGSPFMYVWSTRFTNEWEKVRIPSGWTYEDVLFTANKHNISSYDVLKRMGATK